MNAHSVCTISLSSVHAPMNLSCGIEARCNGLTDERRTAGMPAERSAGGGRGDKRVTGRWMLDAGWSGMYQYNANRLSSMQVSIGASAMRDLSVGQMGWLTLRLTRRAGTKGSKISRVGDSLLCARAGGAGFVQPARAERSRLSSGRGRRRARCGSDDKASERW